MFTHMFEGERQRGSSSVIHRAPLSRERTSDSHMQPCTAYTSTRTTPRISSGDSSPESNSDLLLLFRMGGADAEKAHKPLPRLAAPPRSCSAFL